MLGHVHRSQQGMIAAALRQVFQAGSREEARRVCREVIGRLEPVAPKVAALLEEAEEDLIAFYALPAEHWPKLRSTNPLERVNREIGRRTDVVGIFPNDAALLRLATSYLIEQNDEWMVGRRYLSEGSMALLLGGRVSESGAAEPEGLPAPALGPR
jgi:transposase-like protein